MRAEPMSTVTLIEDRTIALQSGMLVAAEEFVISSIVVPTVVVNVAV